MTEASTLFEVSDGIATLTLNETARMNPLTPGLLAGCLDALQKVQADTSIRVLVITANGKGFCVGADLASLGAKGGDGESSIAGAALEAAPTMGDRVAALMDDGGTPLVKGLRALPVPVLCSVNGAAVGGGVGIALACDVIVAARSAYFYLPFVPSLGLVPDMGAAWFMSRSVGAARTVGMTLLGDRVSAEQAAQWGLIWACVDDADLASYTLGIAKRLAALPSHAAGETRALMKFAGENALDEQLAYERERQRELANSACFAEGVAAFAEKRRAVFAGRK